MSWMMQRGIKNNAAKSTADMMQQIGIGQWYDRPMTDVEKKAYHHITVHVDGLPKDFRVLDPNDMAAFSASPIISGAVWDIMKYPVAGLRHGITMMPQFVWNQAWEDPIRATFTSGNKAGFLNNITKTVGYYSSKGNKILDIYVFSTNTGAFQPFDLNVTTTCQTTISCDSISETTETYRQDVVLNVTEAGYIIYNNIFGQESIYVTVGFKTITDCVIVETIKSPLVLLDPAAFTISSSGTTCTTSNAVLGDCVDITFSANYDFSATAYWLDCNGNQATRFINSGEIFTTTGIIGSGSGLPVTYGNAL
jgi:hypothetical protein